ncbi:MAG TPA: ribbon-helix-helix domain-containing protein [Bryobacteraceae bacterium]|jgi:Arc/MetJ-type ribon-helix-helix transcriptional regulator|nr:ribbon-helix-helix domain-containing protein [Bryobacteraceae bacterium]
MSKKILGAYIGHLSDVPDLQNLLDRFGSKGEGRSNVVMVRLSDEALERVDQLVEATLFSSRSEATAYLVGAGIESQQELFDRLGTHTKEIRKLKEQLRKVALEALQPKKKK